MQETTFEVRVPANLLAFGFDQDRVERHVNEWLVLSLFTEGHISSGKSAQLLGISRIQFLDLLKQRNIAYINYSAEELAEEFEAVTRLKLDRSE